MNYPSARAVVMIARDTDRVPRLVIEATAKRAPSGSFVWIAVGWAGSSFSNLQDMVLDSFETWMSSGSLTEFEDEFLQLRSVSRRCK